MKNSYQGVDTQQINKDGRATHLPVLCEILDLIGGEPSVLEFGMGEWSTRLFCDRCKSVLSIETGSPSWYEKITALHQHVPGFKAAKVIHPTAELTLAKTITSKFDLVFLDGGHTCRGILAQTAMIMGWAPIIVCHDSEEKIYGYSAVVCPVGWEVLEIRDMSTWTLVFTQLSGLLDDLKKVFLNTQIHSVDGLRTKTYLR